MIPYFKWGPWYIPPKDWGWGVPSLDIHLFGILVAIGILVGTYVADKRTLKMGLDPNLSARMAIWVIVGGFIGAHFVEAVFYSTEETLKNPARLFKIWEGISSFGGFLGAIVASALFLRMERLGVEKWHYLDAITYAFPFAWLFGRAGCATAHDHPGIASDFFLAVQFPPQQGGTRLDLGLIEMLLTPLWILASYWAGRKVRAPGFLCGVVAASYAPVRFGLDFFRTVDKRYLGLTPGQFGAMGLLSLGLYLIWRSRSLAAFTIDPSSPRGASDSSAAKKGR